jgi:hypothetical protein
MNRIGTEVLLKEMNEIVRYTLRVFGVRAKWRIVSLRYGDWRKLMTEKAQLDEFSARIKDNLKKAMVTEEGRIEVEENKALREKIRESFRLERQIEKEYGRELSLDEYLESDAMLVAVKAYLQPATKWLRRKWAFARGLAVQNKDVDFLILLNPSITSRNSRRENLITVVHEVLHYVEGLCDDRSSFESIENRAEEIVTQFLEKKRGF